MLLKLWMYLSYQLYLLYLRFVSYRIAWSMYWGAIAEKREALARGEDEEIKIGMDDTLLIYIPKDAKRPVKITQAMKDDYKHDQQLNRLLDNVFSSRGEE